MRAVALAGEMDDDIESIGDLPVNKRERGVGVFQAVERFQPRKGIARVSGVEGGQCTIVSGVQGAKEFRRLVAATLAQDETIRRMCSAASSRSRVVALSALSAGEDATSETA